MAGNVRRSSDQYYGIGAFILTLGIVALSGLGPRMPTAENLLPRGYCYLWTWPDDGVMDAVEPELLDRRGIKAITAATSVPTALLRPTKVSR